MFKLASCICHVARDTICNLFDPPDLDLLGTAVQIPAATCI